MSDELPALLAKYDEAYSPKLGLLGACQSGPGYHSCIPAGTWVHPVRESCDYAVALLEAGGAARVRRAARVLRQVLRLQDTDGASATYGVWPWLLEEPLAQMNPPDLNWADFIGARLAHILTRHASSLPRGLQAQLREALGHAAASIRRRDVGPGYTNIAIMGGGVAALAGEILGDESMLDYARGRLEAVVGHVEFHGTFVEYNSPTYTVVALRECERILAFVRDPSVRRCAETLRRVAWQVIAEHFHPGTGQWAGPHSRAYGDYLSPQWAAYLTAQTGIAIVPHPLAHGEPLQRIPALPCPREWLDRFRRLPNPEVLLHQRFVRNEPEAESTYGTTWMNEEACLGSVNYDCLFFQRRTVLGYWRTSDDSAVALRLRFLQDGRDTAAVAVYNAQSRHRVLSSLGLLNNMGNYHPFYDRPADGCFRAADLRVRYELAGTGVAARPLGAGRFALAAGDHQAVIHTLPGRVGDDPLRWELGREDGRVFLDGIVHHGVIRTFDFRTLATRIAFGLELLPRGEFPLGAPPQVQEVSPEQLEVTWPQTDLRLAVPLLPREFVWAQTSKAEAKT